MPTIKIPLPPICLAQKNLLTLENAVSLTIPSVSVVVPVPVTSNGKVSNEFVRVVSPYVFAIKNLRAPSVQKYCAGNNVLNKLVEFELKLVGLNSCAGVFVVVVPTPHSWPIDERVVALVVVFFCAESVHAVEGNTRSPENNL